MKRVLTLLLITMTLSSCFLVRKIDIEQGNVITSEKVSQVHLGMTKAQVKNIMGTPVLLNTFNDGREDYVYTIKKGNGRMKEKYIVFMFNRHNTLENISDHT